MSRTGRDLIGVRKCVQDGTGIWTDRGQVMHAHSPNSRTEMLFVCCVLRGAVLDGLITAHEARPVVVEGFRIGELVRQFGGDVW